MLKKIIEAKINIIESSKASKEGTLDKMYINFDLLHTLPDINYNGASFDKESTEAKADTVAEGYINVEHDDWFNVGSVLNAEYVEGENSDKINCDGVLWKSVLENFDITPEDIKNGEYKISMEVLYKDYMYLYGDELVNPDEYSELADHVGQTYQGKQVAMVIKPEEFKGCALVKDPADSEAIINEAVANKLTNTSKIINKKEIEENQGGKDMFKELEFETEEEYNNYLEDIRQGYASVESLLGKFEEMNIDAKDVDALVEGVASIKEDLEETKEEYENFKAEAKLKERKTKLEEAGLELEEDDEEIAELSDKAFNMILKASKTKEDKEDVEVEDADKDEEEVKEEEASEEDIKFDPNLHVTDDDFDVDSIINAL